MALMLGRPSIEEIWYLSIHCMTIKQLNFLYIHVCSCFLCARGSIQSNRDQSSMEARVMHQSTHQLVNIVALPPMFLPAESLHLLSQSLAKMVESVPSFSTSLKLIVKLIKHCIRANLMARKDNRVIDNEVWLEVRGKIQMDNGNSLLHRVCQEKDRQPTCGDVCLLLC